MERLRKFFLLSFDDRRLLMRSVVLLTVIKLGLRLLPFRTMRRLLAKATRTGERTGADPSLVEKVVWAVEAVHSHIPVLKNCLSEALAAQVLLARQGHISTLRIGVARSESGELRAHAWIEVDGRVIMGGARSPSCFVALPSLEKQ